MKTIKTTTNLFRFIRPCFYESNADPRYMFEEEMNNKIMKETDFDFEGYKKEFIPYIQKQADVAKEKLKDIGVIEIKVLSIESPREYNFYTDWCELEVKVEDGWENKAAEKLKGISESPISKDLMGSWKSRSGFISFMPQTYHEIIEGVKDGEELAIGAYLTLCLWNNNEWREERNLCKDLDDFSWDLVTEEVSGKLLYEDFATLEYVIPEEYVDLYEKGSEFEKDMFFHKMWEEFGYKWKSQDNKCGGDHLLALLMWMKETGK